MFASNLLITVNCGLAKLGKEQVKNIDEAYRKYVREKFFTCNAA